MKKQYFKSGGYNLLASFSTGRKTPMGKCGQFNTNEEIEAYLKKGTDSIFGVDGYPHEWVDKLEK